jgi:hypothetical protein
MHAGGVAAWVCLPLCTGHFLHHQRVRARPIARGWAGGVLTCRMHGGGTVMWVCLPLCTGRVLHHQRVRASHFAWTSGIGVGACWMRAGGVAAWECLCDGRGVQRPRVRARLPECEGGMRWGHVGCMQVASPRGCACAMVVVCSARLCARASLCVGGWVEGECVGCMAGGAPRGWVCALVAAHHQLVRVSHFARTSGIGVGARRMRAGGAVAVVCLCPGRNMHGRPMPASSRTVSRCCGGPVSTCPRGRVSGCACGCGCKQHHLPVRARCRRFIACGLRGVGAPCCRRGRPCVGAHCGAAAISAHPVRHGPPACTSPPAVSLVVA